MKRLPEDCALIERNTLDCQHTATLYRVLSDQLKTDSFFHARYKPFYKRVIQMQLAGIPCRDLRAYKSSLTRNLQALVADHFPNLNPNSQKQMHDLFISDYGLKPNGLTTSGRQTFDMPHIERLLRDLRKKDEPARLQLTALLQYRRTFRLRETIDDQSGNRLRPRLTPSIFGTIDYRDPDLSEWNLSTLQDIVICNQAIEYRDADLLAESETPVDCEAAYHYFKNYGVIITPWGNRIRLPENTTRKNLDDYLLTGTAAWQLNKIWMNKPDNPKFILRRFGTFLVGY